MGVDKVNYISFKTNRSPTFNFLKSLNSTLLSSALDCDFVTLLFTPYCYLHHSACCYATQTSETDL